MRFFCTLTVYLGLLFSYINGSTYSLNDLRILFQQELCIEGKLDVLLLNRGDKIEEDTKTEGILSLTSVGTIEEAEKPVLSRLNELAGFHQIDHYFKLEKEEGPAHEKTFTLSLTFGKETYIGQGRSLKKAKQDAAAKALEKTEYECPEPKKKTPKDIEKLTPTVLLNNLGSKLGVVITYYLIDKDKEQILHSNIVLTEKTKSYVQKLNDSIYSDKKLHMKKDIDSTKGPFRIKLKFGEHVFYATSHSIQSGRHEVASLALEFLAINRDTLDFACLREGLEEDCKKNKEQLKSPISKVHEQAQKRQLSVEFELIKESGPSHKRSFLTECRLGDIISTGEGFSKKESKRIAAENMLEKLKDFEPVEIQIPHTGKDKKKRKRKKTKMIKNKIDEISMALDNVGKTVLGFAKNIFGEDNQINDSNDEFEGSDIKKTDTQQKRDSKTASGNSKTSQDELLELSNVLNVKVGFTDFKEDNKHGSLLSLLMNPEYTCFGEGNTEFMARNSAAKNALGLLNKMGIYDLFLEQTDTSLKREIKEETRVILDQLVLKEKEEL
ncbi:unnamed protein product [Psylliodes chrysocephalus]|uniref:DRBM domain-containing protein n=1 Tax=Psylliodes chrysocephalus TaxID=3402493 RepID=A0A9P0GFW8_9CUCU|nr:unnamed protein product [Psylliodes chrysocephala]